MPKGVTTLPSASKGLIETGNHECEQTNLLFPVIFMCVKIMK